jgi:hypothetical protein
VQTNGGKTGEEMIFQIEFDDQAIFGIEENAGRQDTNPERARLLDIEPVNTGGATATILIGLV